jgi:hypothetical protein
LQIKTKIVSCHTADSKPVKQEVNCAVILPPLVVPGRGHNYVGQVVFDSKSCNPTRESVSNKSTFDRGFAFLAFLGNATT